MTSKASDSPRRRAPKAGPRFSVGACVGTAFSAWARHAVPFAIVSLVCQVPVFAAIRFVGGDMFASGPDGLIRALAAMLLSLLAWNLSLGAITFGVLESLRGGRATIGRCLGVAFRTLPRLFGISFRMALHLLLGGALAILVVALVVSLLPFGETGEAPTFLSPPRVFVTGALLGIALLEYLARFATSGPIAVVEGVDHWESMERSRRLSFGRRWAVGTTLFLVVAAPTAFTIWLSFYGPAAPGAGGGAEAWRWVADGIQVLVTGPLVGAAVAAIYHDLRREREGVGADDLAGVFD